MMSKDQRDNHQLLPECEQRFDRLSDDVGEIKRDVKKVFQAICGPNGPSISERIAAMESFRKGMITFVILVGIVASIVGVLWKLLSN